MEKEQLKLKILDEFGEIIRERDDSMLKDNYPNAYYCIGYCHALRRVLSWIGLSEVEIDELEKIK